MKPIFLTTFLVVIALLAGLYFGNTTVPKVNSLKEEVLPTSTLSPTPIELNAETIFNLVNNWRSENSLPIYKKDDRLCPIARTRLNEIKSDWSHNQFNISRCPFCNYLGENLARNFYTERMVLDAWLASPTHLDVLKHPYTHSCLVTESTFAVQLFASY